MAKSFQNPPVLEPRLLTKLQVCEYLGISPSSFENWMQKGVMPGALPETKRWDKRAIDHRLDRLSGLKDGPDNAVQAADGQDLPAPDNDDDDDDWGDVEE